ncbi:general transcriptional corepressor trfA-like [Pieris rapae]|uniref:general transcriptional corepressor trfA-like n=1 Tax=Pieris rapae TaxID=64459 RepID=UPI001E27C824|nr:general transcriptional corepressor trfA-like [Pieris rapae]
MGHDRLLAVGLAVVLSFIEAPVNSFTLSRETNITHDDLHPEDSIVLEVRNDVRRPNDIEITKADGLIPTSEIYFKDFKFITSIQDQAVDSSIDTTQNIEFTTQYVEPSENKETTDTITDNEHSKNKKYNGHLLNSTNKETKSTPSWKKYTEINRKVVNSELNNDRDQTEGMLTDETGVPRQDSKSGDKPSLNQLKNFLFPSSFFKSDIVNDTTSMVGVTDQSYTGNPVSTDESTTPTKANIATVESKRGGFLDFSLKSLFEDNNDKKENSQENNTSKPKGRRLSWRFGSRYRGKEDNSAEKSKERSRYRFRNNKDRKADNNNTKESKEEYSKEIDSREDSDKKTLRPTEKDTNGENYQNKSENNNETKVSRDQTNVSEKEILAEWNQYENNKGNPNNGFQSDNLSSKEKLKLDEEGNRKKMEHSKYITTTEINIWYTGSGEKTRSREKEQRKITENKIPKERNELRRPHSSNNAEESRDNNSKNRGRNTSKHYNNEDESSQLKSQDRDNKDKIKGRYNDPRTDKNKPSYIKEYNTYNSQNLNEMQNNFNNIKNNAMDSHTGEKPSNNDYVENQTIQYHPIKTTEVNEESDQEITITRNNSTSDIIDITNNDDIKQENISSDKQVTLEYIKQYLSTIDEEEENESHSPTIDEISTAKPVDVPNIAAVNYSADLKLNDIDTTTEALDPYEPFKIPNLLISLPSSRNKDGALHYSKLNQNEAKQYINTVETATESGLTEKYSTDFINPTTIEQKYGTKNKDTKNTEAFIQMREDDRREELLKEEVINNYEENFRKYNYEVTTTQQSIIPVKIYEVNQKPEDEKLSVKPLTFLDRLKTTILYPVGINYKPLKKIEVQPPKPFMRDPDDNSWRNESLSSLGIVFKPKNSSKPFTQVLKNKTETEWNNLMEKQNTSEVPDLRERLEKIAEMRKSKKKKTDAYGNVLYNDYEESFSKETKDSEFPTSTTTTTMISTTEGTTTSTVAPFTEPESLSYSKSITNSTTEKPKKVFNAAEYYDTSEEDDADYLTLAKIDLKKFTVPMRTDAYVTPPTWLVTNTRPENHNNYERKPTLQYFPPLTTQKGMFRDYDTDFHKKMGGYTETEPPTNVLPVSYTRPLSPIPNDRTGQLFTPASKHSNDRTTTEFIDYEKPGFMTQAPVIPDPKDGYTVVTDDGSYNRAADVIKHYRDFLNAVAKDHEEDINEDYNPYTKIPTQGVTVSDIIHRMKPKPDMAEHYDYDNDFRKDVLQRFVHNFNQNSERFKSGLPMLYNNSIIHGSAGDGREVASSRAYLSRMLTRPSGDCDNNATVELSPAYELHYYVPEEEEKEQIDPKPATLPYQYRL